MVRMSGWNRVLIPLLKNELNPWHRSRLISTSSVYKKDEQGGWFSKLSSSLMVRKIEVNACDDGLIVFYFLPPSSIYSLFFILMMC